MEATEVATRIESLERLRKQYEREHDAVREHAPDRAAEIAQAIAGIDVLLARLRDEQRRGL